MLALRPLYQHRDENEGKALQMPRLHIKLKKARPEQMTDIGEGMTHRVGPEDDETNSDKQERQQHTAEVLQAGQPPERGFNLALLVERAR